MRAILLIVLLHLAIAQQSEEEVDRGVSRLEARIQQLEQAIQLAAQQAPVREDRMSAMEERVTAQMTSIMERMTSPQEQNQCCDVASSMVRDFNQLHLELLDRDARAVESQLLEMRELVQSAVGDVSATEERIASANLATEERLAANVVRQIENMTSLIEKQKERINDLEHRTTAYVDCKDLLNKGFSRNGVYTIRSPEGVSMQVYCNMENDGGGWTVIQRRMDGSQDFLLGWQRYAAGFGDLRGEFWLGNRNLNFLTGLWPHELKITLMDWDGQTRYAHYDAFSVGAEADKFPLTLGDYSGNAGDSMARNNGRRFSTVDQDNDHSNSYDCTSYHKGAWWQGYCTYANLNGLYLRGSYSGDLRGVFWAHWRGQGYSLKHTEMKMRRL